MGFVQGSGSSGKLCHGELVFAAHLLPVVYMLDISTPCMAQAVLLLRPGQVLSVGWWTSDKPSLELRELPYAIVRHQTKYYERQLEVIYKTPVL